MVANCIGVDIAESLERKHKGMKHKGMELRGMELRGMKLRTRIFLGSLSPILLLVMLNGFTYSHYWQMRELQEEIETEQETIREVSQLTVGLSKMVRAVRGQVLFPTEEDYQDTYQEGLEQFQEASSGIIEMLEDDPEHIEPMEKVLAEANELIEVSERVFALVKAGQIQQATALTAEIQLEGLEDIHQRILYEEEENLVDKRLEAESARSFLLILVTVGTIIAAAIALTLNALISSVISRTLQESIVRLTTSSNQIATTVEQQERIANQQVAEVNATTATMDELEASFRHTSEQAKAAATGAGQVLELAKSGIQAVEDNLEGMSNLEKEMELIAEEIMQLSEQANQIGTISQLVSDIASQTNMLALNSSVEAVRAGEHGKGFGIVANEIRKFADQSQQSAGKINELVSQIQNAIYSTVMATEKGTKLVTVEVKTAKGTEQAFTEVSQAIDKVALNTQQISLNLKQQLDGVHQVLQAMESVDCGTKETASGISQTKISTQQLSEIAQSLERLI
ncbi:MAG: chemotaxis protein [Leptolyngbyaceae cyanobacterium SM1_4_3]|nr:chemotaxis protein [Leptolyngbyaceae cyanobacterium SM1_4_3]NJN90919.1 chemotaxis protein [Leptolyngbyaceae cyanobacterium SL_5_14]